jgi:hypothetical protein
MPLTGDARRAASKSYYDRTRDTRLFIAAVRNVLDGSRPNDATRLRYGWDEREVNRIRALDARFRAVLEDKHGVSLGDLYKGRTAKEPIRFAEVRKEEPPAKPPRPDYPQGLEETPAKGTNTPITWAQIDTFWTGPVKKHEMGSNSARKVMKDGELTNQNYAPAYTRAVRTTFRQIREEFAKAGASDNAVPVLRKASELMAWLRARYRKTAQQVEADATVQDSSVGAVAGRADDDEEVTSGRPAVSGSGEAVAVSKPATAVRARTKSSELKQVSQTYSSKLGHVVTTFGAWRVFRDSLGTDVLQAYRGTFGEGEVGLFQAIQADREVQGNKAKSPLHAVPSYEMLVRYLPKIKDKVGASTGWLAALLQVKLLGLRDNLGGVEIRRDDGPVYNPTAGDSSRDDWYNRTTGRLYIAHFKTAGARFGTPYDFQLSDVRGLKEAVDETLRDGHPEAGRAWLVGVGRGGGDHSVRAGLPLPAGPKIKAAFMAAGLVFKQLNRGKLIDTSPTPVDIRHAQVTWKHREMSRANPRLTATQISEKIAGFFNHASDVNIGYLRLTFDSVDDPLAKKQGGRAADPFVTPPRTKGPRSARKPRVVVRLPPEPASVPMPSEGLRRSARARARRAET